MDEMPAINFDKPTDGHDIAPTRPLLARPVNKYNNAIGGRLGGDTGELWARQAGTRFNLRLKIRWLTETES